MLRERSDANEAGVGGERREFFFRRAAVAAAAVSIGVAHGIRPGARGGCTHSAHKRARQGQATPQACALATSGTGGVPRAVQGGRACGGGKPAAAAAGRRALAIPLRLPSKKQERGAGPPRHCSSPGHASARRRPSWSIYSEGAGVGGCRPPHSPRRPTPPRRRRRWQGRFLSNTSPRAAAAKRSANHAPRCPRPTSGCIGGYPRPSFLREGVRVGKGNARGRV
jgi:hypothetical protein